MPEPIPRLIACLAVTTWLTVVSAGFVAWNDYDTTPGGNPTDPVDRTAEPGLRIEVYVHPHCPCSRATLHSLNEVLHERDYGPGQVRVVFVCPPGVPAGWEQGPLWDLAAELPGAERERDVDGLAAQRAGASAAGFVVAYAADGSVAFVGGVTPGRGQRGEGAGLRAVRDVLLGKVPAVHSAPVFGCPLFDSAARPASGGETSCPR